MSHELSNIDKRERARQRALLAYELLDTAPEEGFDRLTELAAAICETPIALVSLIDDSRQWFKSRIGLEPQQTAREVAFCNHAIRDTGLFEVTDATLDKRFMDNPLVLSDPNIRFYAGQPLLDPDGYALGTLCVIDREPRQLSEYQRRALALLADEVIDQILARRDRMLLEQAKEKAERAQAEAEAANQMKSRFLAVVSHEIRTPLSTIVGYPQLILNGIASLSREEIAEHARVIFERGQALLALLNDLIDLSRIEANEISLNLQPLSLVELFETIRRGQQALLCAHGFSLEVEVEPAAGYVQADDMRLHQVLANLLSNAKKASPPGGSIGLRATREGDRVLISVTDQGRGMTAAQQERILESFYQAGTYADEGTQGAGLGLSIVKRIVDLHQGELQITSEVGRGSTFTVALEAAEPARELPPLTVLAGGCARGDTAPVISANVLVVDDDHTSGLLLTKLLEHEGFYCHRVVSGEQALEICARDSFDVVFLDNQLPGIDGAETMRRLRATIGASAPTIVALTADATPDARRRYIDLGFDAYEPKPVMVADLAKRVASYASRDMNRA
ncbi:MAG: hypothetical protein Tsb0020_22890 [Haliangiales bacterium]